MKFFDLTYHSDNQLDRRQLRLQQMIHLVLFGMLLSGLQNVYFQRWYDVAIIFSAAIPALISLALIRRQQLDRAGALFCYSIAGVLTLVHWSSTGLYDPAMIAYPTLIVLAAIACSRRVFWSIFALILLSLTLLSLGDMQGWHPSRVAPIDIGFWIDLMCILFITALMIYVFTQDLQHALATLQEENLQTLKSKAHIEFLAHHDALTQLPNRVLAKDRCEHALAHAARQNSMAALIFIDLDNFKTINDSLGHSAGDALLTEMARRLQTCVRASDTVARQGGDEFLIILENIASAKAAQHIAATIIATVAEPVTFGSITLTTTCSLGIALSPLDGDDFDTLLQKADMAMYRAKAAGRNSYFFYDAAINTNAVEHLQLASSMRNAIARGEFMLHYQPQIDLLTGDVIGAEALVRWRHPELGLVPPAKFIPIAENAGLIIEIGEWIVHQACQQTRQWQDEGIRDLMIGINISPIQFRRGDVENLVLQALARSGLAAQYVELELTESLLLEDSSALRSTLQQLRGHGISFSIDDFGTGYSNLSYLKHFEVERLKIDQSFIRRLTEDPHDAAIVSAIIQVADSLQLALIAEGIENAATLQRLIELGCKQGQGYHWSPALPADEFKAFVLAHRQKLAEA
ncbi:putative bifunctional diguanylate cyclase/phosphodiesterase [Deefgea rivuli]|uniref:putative bifunctional diguanylate cyclase/phosphodiesterase n=1 Tax=Deefgea rivuli TaxID=400948 RepID=UPI000A00C5EF|nr:EAL domain-containing protein [Deefgea rivuli]